MPSFIATSEQKISGTWKSFSILLISCPILQNGRLGPRSLWSNGVSLSTRAWIHRCIYQL